MKIFIPVVLFLSVFSVAALAAEVPAGRFNASDSQKLTSSEISSSRTTVETIDPITPYRRFHFYIGGGWATASYLNDDVNPSTITHDAGRVGFNGEVGFYWRLADSKFTLGTAFGFSSDNFSKINDNLSISSNFTQFPIALSSTYSFGSRVGSGLFARLDLGPTVVSYSNTVSDYSSASYYGSSRSRYAVGVGFGTLLGLGYSLPMSKNTSVMAMGSVAYRNIDDISDSSSLSASEGALSNFTYALNIGFLL